MEQRHLGRSGLWVSTIALGTMTWGEDTEEGEAADLLATFVDAGGTLIDTADIYQGGQGERILGRLLPTVVRRDDVIIATKAGHCLDRRRPSNTSRRHLLAALEASLRRLQTDYVDLWQLHVYDPTTPLEETLAAVDSAVASGKARYVGVGQVTGWQLARYATWQQATLASGSSPIVAVGTEYSLLNRECERELLPAARACGVGILAWSPLGRGVLTGKYRTGVPRDSRGASAHMASFVEPYLDEQGRRIVESVYTAAQGLGVPPLGVALRWVLSQPGVAAACVGPRTVAQLSEILAAENVVLPREISEALADASAAAV
ncbi:aldo/keto reductase [Thermobifida fusca]|jgi:aryl-alcohol dehydrogenase-like predicted oxidoreductase|uniref:Oxidoreductase n=2 Tax=Thermobifida fusca TaxID=2021 RepID=A0A9P2TAD7_THEFU|nr:MULTISPECIES: aldo/keto reductase [Thermobifida]AAZ55872.1 putative oxidoreductase [Thermobifida fusca YX]EOR71093.1 oxidoreductase [Thermobifida fusca TM51]MBO2530770.1 aldo/keto reductase [Thermobifida sp.]MDD6791746.1 aldo/keto reductase [Thermobifida fusca]PPS93533.1 aldo/keto reductase [Thermobifida fusca]